MKEASVVASVALTTGLLVWLSFPPAGLSFVSLVAWVPLFAALRWRASSPGWLGLGLGWLTGMVVSALGLGFVLPALIRVSGASPAVCAALFAALVAWEALRFGLFGWIASRAIARGHSPTLVLVMAFTASEVAFPSLVPWTSGAPLHGFVPLVQVADLGGAIAVSAVVATVNALVCELGIAFLERRRPARVAMALAFVPAFALIYGAIQIASIDARAKRAPSLAVGVVQPRLDGGVRDASASYHVGASRELAREGAELVVWSESVLPGPYPADDLAGALRAGITGRLGVPAVVGVAIDDGAERASPRTHNSAVVTERDGSVVGRYDKRRLLPFGEFVPFEERFPALRSLLARSGAYAPGVRGTPLELAGHRLITSICFEDVLGTYVRELVLESRPELLVNIGNDGWFVGSNEPELRFLVSRIRAVEHRRYLVHAANEGVSAVVDPVGRVAMRLPSGEAAGIERVAWLGESTVYDEVGNAPWWAVAAASALMALVGRTKRVGTSRAALPKREERAVDAERRVTSSAPS